jgi:hypothetical protein
LNLGDTGHDMPKVSSTAVDNRYHKLVWGEAGIQTGDRYSNYIPIRVFIIISYYLLRAFKYELFMCGIDEILGN